MSTRNVLELNGWIWRWRAAGVDDFQMSQGRGAFLYEFDRKAEEIEKADDGDGRNDALLGLALLNILADRLTSERLRTMHAIVDVKEKRRRDLSEVCALLNQVVAVVVGYQQAVSGPRKRYDEAVIIARAEERLECFLEEVERMVHLFLPTMEDGQHPLAWDQRRFVLRPNAQL